MSTSTTPEKPKSKSCPITRTQFTEHAKAIEVMIAGVKFLAEVKEFSTGSLGWYLSAKTKMMFGDVAVPVQVGVTVTCIGSKEAPQ